MSEPLALGIVGIGRMGWVHATHLLALEREQGVCRLSAVVDQDAARLRSFAGALGYQGPLFESVEEYVLSGLCRATMVVSPTEHHQRHAMTLIRAGHRVLMEKPLTGTLSGDLACAAELDRDFPGALMLAFQRRFDPALAHGRALVQQGAIGRLFKIYSALEDSGPPPDTYQSGGILPDMSVHNVDEILWFAGHMPDRAMATGSVLYNKHIAGCQEDYDDAMLHMWFGEELLGQVQVTRNHVSGYRVESVLYGDQGQIQIGRFSQRPSEVVVEAYGRRGRAGPLDRRVFPGGDGGPGVPEFVERFGPAYKAEAAAFIECCRHSLPFPTSHHDGLRAQRVIEAAMSVVKSRLDGAPVE
ncbi:MAG: Gfo/Idh/MocA family oxidoreductase [Bryobacterales bacterium]|nr:Gfo/Idh/MocA family oxidoreductase [Bryobacterales bacterium]